MERQIGVGDQRCQASTTLAYKLTIVSCARSPRGGFWPRACHGAYGSARGSLSDDHFPTLFGDLDLFDDFANVWTIAGLARDIRKKPVQFRVAGQRIVLFRGSDGKLGALLDRCPHRGVALSLGKVEGGNLVCPFHGWRFTVEGKNCHVPWSPNAKREQLGAIAIPVREVKGLIWLYTGFDTAGEPTPPDTLDAPGVVVSAQSMLWSVHWTRVMENMLDKPHLAFVHRKTIGRGLRMLVGQDMVLN